jgi:hypothetical protein
MLFRMALISRAEPSCRSPVNSAADQRHCRQSGELRRRLGLAPSDVLEAAIPVLALSGDGVYG